MEKQNVTLSIPKDILLKAKVIAINNNTSLSALLGETLTDLVMQADQYALAHERNLARLDQGYNLGTGGQTTWTREELHDR